MGAWGDQPWDNDDAADFFGDLWEDTPIVDRVIAGLTSGTSSVVVAASWLLLGIGRVYVWPVDRLDEALTAAIDALEVILTGEDEEGYLALWDDDPAVAARLRGYRDELISRLRPEPPA